MANRPASFSQVDLTRALKATRAAGFEVGRIEIEPGGRIIVIPGKPMKDGPISSWDEVLQ